jgi:hypothetical protein
VWLAAALKEASVRSGMVWQPCRCRSPFCHKPAIALHFIMHIPKKKLHKVIWKWLCKQKGSIYKDEWQVLVIQRVHATSAIALVHWTLKCNMRRTLTLPMLHRSG